MRCQNCEEQIPEGERFCPHCGVPVGDVVKCTHCGAALLPGERFCGECGREMKAAVPPPGVKPPASGKRSPWLWVAIAVAGIAILGCLACIVIAIISPPTSTPTPAWTATFTPIPPPTLPPTPTPTPTPSLRPSVLLYEEDFTSPSEAWEIEDVGNAEYKLDGGTYSIEVRQESWMAWNTAGEGFSDFVLDLDALLVEGSQDNSYGCLFRYQDKNNHYELSITGNQSYSFGKDVDGEWTQIVEWTSSNAIKPTGQVNHIRLIAYGDDFSLYVNGQFVDEFTDPSFLDGEIAPVVTAYDEPPTRATFDNIKIWDVERR